MTLDCYKGCDMPHEPTALTRELVKNLYAVGVTQDKIAARINISDETLRKYYRKELDEALQDMNINVMNAGYLKALDGDVTAIFKWLKMRAGWKEADNDNNNDKVAQYLLDQLHKQDTDAKL